MSCLGWARLAAALWAFLFSAGYLRCEVRLTGTFVAQKACPATKKKNTDNPGNIVLEVGTTYRLHAKNGEPGTHFHIVVPGAPVTRLRWVEMNCGTAAINRNGGLAVDVGGGQASRFAPNSLENILAASWQPGFCATRGGRNKPECKSQTSRRPDARQFSIHGLWPNDLDDRAKFPCYCDHGTPVSCEPKNDKKPFPTIDLAPAIRNRLAMLMPGTQSGLDLHEWTKHGTCYEDDLPAPSTGADANEYFSDTIALLEQLNDTQVRRLFAANVGRELSRARVEAAFDAAFGRGAGQKVAMVCANKAGSRTRVIVELRIGLKGEITPSSDLRTLIQAAPDRLGGSCKSGLVVEVK
ncbi:MAG: ribonuclease I [Pseudomonadota bacterium]